MRLPDEAVRALLETPYEQIADLWGDVLEAAGPHEESRALCQDDRFYVLTVALARTDADKTWLYAQRRVVPVQPARVDATGGGKAKSAAPRLPGYVVLSRR